MRPFNDRWEFVNGILVNICIDCNRDFSNECMCIGKHPNVTNLASTIRCHSCAGLLPNDWNQHSIVGKKAHQRK